MTEKIKSAIEQVKWHKADCTWNIQEDTCDFIINSLNAWEKIIEELKEERDRFDRCKLKGEVIGIMSAIEVINQHLTKIEE